jgi:hypothetical protein
MNLHDVYKIRGKGNPKSIDEVAQIISEWLPKLESSEDKAKFIIDIMRDFASQTISGMAYEAYAREKNEIAESLTKCHEQLFKRKSA